MKIAVVTPGILPVPPLKGGAVETLVETLISENEKHADFDIDLFSVYADGIEACAEPYRRTRFHFIKISPAGNLLIRICNKMLITLHIDRRLDLYMKKLRRYVRGRKIDRNHYDAIIVENSYQVIAISKLFRQKVLLHLHNDNICPGRKGVPEIINACAKIFAVSRFIEARIKAVDAGARVAVIHNGVDTGRFRPGAAAGAELALLQRKYGIAADDRVILYAGRFTEGKGIAELIRAFSGLPGRRLKLLVVGSAWFGLRPTSRFVKHLREMSAPDRERIIFTGFISNTEMAGIYSLADIAAVPSIRNEAFPMVVIEAMAAGVPVITTNRGGMVEAVDPGCGLIIDNIGQLQEQLADKLKYLLGHDEVRAALSAGARARAEELFTIGRYYENMKNAIMDRED